MNNTATAASANATAARQMADIVLREDAASLEKIIPSLRNYVETQRDNHPHAVEVAEEALDLIKADMERRGAAEEQLRSMLREAQEADASARDARLWASPTYVAAKEAAAELAWVAYLKASEALLGSYWGVEYK